MDWPRGLRALVGLGAGLIVLACLIALTSGWLRAGGELIVASDLESSMPAGMHSVMVVLLVLTVSIGQTAGMHAPWWLTVISTTICAVFIGLYGLIGVALTGPLVPGLVAVLIVGLICFTVVRHRRRFAWWEFVVVLSVIGVGVALGMGTWAARSRQFGAELIPQLTHGTVQNLMVLAMPAAVAAGTAVAELSVGLTVAAAAQIERIPGWRWPYVLLAVLAAVRLGEVGWRILRLDPVHSGWLAVLPATVILVLLGVVIGGLLRIAERFTAAPVTISDLPEDLGRVALPFGAVIVAAGLPLIVAGTIYAIVIGFDPVGAATRPTSDPITPITELIDVIRLGLAAALVVFAMRLVRRGRAMRAVLFGGIAVTVAATSMRVVVAQRWAIWFDPDTVNLLASAAVLLGIGWYAVRRRLTQRRAVAASTLLMLCLLFSLRQFLGDPVGELVGYSGVGLVVFGLLWDLMTSSAWGNGDSRRFPRPTRVLLVLTNTALLAVVVAYASLVRDAGGLSLDDFAELGDLVLGVGLLAAVFAVVTQAFVRDRPLD